MRGTTFAALIGTILILSGCERYTEKSPSRTTAMGAPISIDAPLEPSPELIPFTVIKRTEHATTKVSFDLLVDLVDGRLPTEAELAAISRHLYGIERSHERTFVLYFLPGMEPGSGAFATAHHDPELNVQILDYMLPDRYKHLIAVREPTFQTSIQSADAIVEPPADQELVVTARRLSETVVELMISTNIPLPIEVMADLSLKGQKDSDVWIGYQERVRLEESPQRVLLDTSKGRKPLPIGDYEAELYFNHRYAKNSTAAAIKGSIEAKTDVGQLGNGVSAAEADEQNQARRWAMENVSTGTEWNEREFIDRLGLFEKLKSDLRSHEAYYFPRPDMTFLVNPSAGTITTWRLGRQLQ